MRAINLIYREGKYGKEKLIHINVNELVGLPFVNLNDINTITITDGSPNGERVIFAEKMYPSHLIEENKRLKKLVDYYERLEYLI